MSALKKMLRGRRRHSRQRVWREVQAAHRNKQNWERMPVEARGQNDASKNMGSGEALRASGLKGRRPASTNLKGSSSRVPEPQTKINQGKGAGQAAFVSPVRLPAGLECRLAGGVLSHHAFGGCSVPAYSWDQHAVQPQGSTPINRHRFAVNESIIQSASN